MREYQARQTPAQQLHQELLLKWRCLKVGCNGGFDCYVDGKDEHFPMSAIQSKLWARDIDKEGSTVTQERPSTVLLGMLTSEKRQQRKQAKKSQSEQSQPTPTAAVPPSFSAPGPTINYYIATPHPSVAASPPPPRPPRPPHPPSSPVRGEMTLKDYIDWHVKKQPNRREQFWRAYNKLDEECYMIHHIQRLKDTMDPKIAELWRSLDIPLGLGRQLAEDASTFAREFEQDRAGSPVLPIRLSPRSQDTWQQSAQRPQLLRPIMQSVESELGSPTEDEDSQFYMGRDRAGEDLDDSQALL